MRRNLAFTPVRFPDGDAAAARVLGIGRALRDGGLKVCSATRAFNMLRKMS
jgi:hypothetical protein